MEISLLQIFFFLLYCIWTFISIHNIIKNKLKDIMNTSFGVFFLTALWLSVHGMAVLISIGWLIITYIPWNLTFKL